jgi:hypothetical protein
MNVKVVRNLLLLVLFSAVFSFVTVSAYAELPVTKAEKSVSVEIKYTGSSPDFLNFSVAVHSTGNQKLVLRIKDENGHELYRENIGKRDFTKFIKVFRNDYSRLQFVVDTQDGQYKKSFKIQSEILESINVTEDN